MKRKIVIDADPILFSLASPPSEAWRGTLKGRSIKKPISCIKGLKKAFKKAVAEIEDIAQVESISHQYTIGKTIVVISDESNFRYDIYPEYKANRKGREHTDEFIKLRKWARKKYAPKQNLEADDVVAYYVREGAIGFSIDKDLLYGVEGIWFNTHHAHRDWVYTSKAEAKRFNLIQCIMGDSTDNIKGIAGIGEVKAIALLDEYGWSYSGVLKAYKHHGLGLKDALLTHRLVSMKQWTKKSGLQMHTQLKAN